MATAPTRPERTRLPGGQEISRMVTGLWQVADMERTGPIDLDAAAASLADYAEAGFDTFDMADHYGSAELIVARLATLRERPVAFTKWCPEPGPMTAEVVRAGIAERLERLATDRIDLLQLHWWTFRHPGWLDAFKELQRLREEGRIAQLGVTNFDTDHLHVLVRQGFRIATNQVCVSLLDRRALGAMSTFCMAEGTRLLAYGTLAGGFLTDRWLGKPEPAATEITDWSRMKYRRFIEAAGGWEVLQTILRACDAVARKHGVSIANVATRWVLDQPAVAAVIVGARPGGREHRADNLRTFAFAFDDADRARIDAALATATAISGDCGDEYRKPPYLTASGDLSHHLKALPPVWPSVPVPGKPGRMRVDTGSIWEPLAGYSRAVRIGDRILVSGTTATHGSGEVVCKGDVHGQCVYILDKIAASIEALGGSLEDVVRTRVYLCDAAQWEPASQVHGRFFGAIRPANTLLVIAGLIGDYAVEIEAEAVTG